MKPTWKTLVGVVVVGIAVAGWALYLREHGRVRQLISEMPTPTPPAASDSVFGAWQKAEGDMVFVGVTAPGATTDALTSRQYRISGDVTVMRFDAQKNEYVPAVVTDIAPGTWVQLQTDSSGTVIAIYAGR